MPDREIRKHWETVHSEKQDAVSWFQDRPKVSLDLLLGGGLARDTPVIDIGGGASRLVDCLLDKGFTDVTVLDIADSGLVRTRDRLGERAAAVNWLVADVTQWKPSREYGAWHDRAVFHFLVSEDDREAYRQALRSGVRPGGYVVIGTFAEDGPERCSGLPVTRYSATALAQAIGKGFEVVGQRDELHETPGGKSQPFQFVAFKRVS